METNEIETLLKNDVIDRHSLFQLKYFIIGKEPTHQAKLWRCLRELKARKESLDSVEFEIEDTEDEIALMKIEAAEKPDTEKQKILDRRANRRITALSNKVIELKRKKKFIGEEAEFFVKAYKALESKEKLKAFDDVDSQIDYWNSKLKNDLSIRAILHQLPDVELLKTILCLENSVPVKQDVMKMIVIDPNESKQLTK